MSPTPPELPSALKDAFGSPTGLLAFDSPTGQVPLWVFTFEDSFVLATSTLAPLVGVDVTLRAPREAGEERPSPLLPHLLQAVVTAWLSGERALSHGEAVPLMEPSLGLVLPVLALRDTRTGAGWLRLVLITSDELELLQTMDAEGLRIGLEEHLPGLISLQGRQTVITPERAAELAASHPPSPCIQRTLQVASWVGQGDQYFARLDEAGLIPLSRMLEDPSRFLLAKDGRHTLEIHLHDRESCLIDEQDDRLVLTLPAEAIRRLIRDKQVGMGDASGGFVLDVIATDVTPAPLTELLREPPTRSMPRAAHALFTTRVLPALADDLFEQLQTTHATNALRHHWGEVNQLLQSGQLGGGLPGMDKDPQPHCAMATVPGTRVQARVGLGVARTLESAGHRIFVVQMPPAQAPTEAHYVALAQRPGEPTRLLTWEKTHDGYATLAEWWLQQGGPSSELLDKQGSAHLEQFIAQIKAWLQAHPQRPDASPTSSPGRAPDGSDSPPPDEQDWRPTTDWTPIAFSAGALLLLLGGVGLAVYLAFPEPIHLWVLGENASQITPATASARVPAGEPVLEPLTPSTWGAQASWDQEGLRLLRQGVLYEGSVAALRPRPAEHTPVAVLGPHQRFERSNGGFGTTKPYARVELNLDTLSAVKCSLLSQGELRCIFQDQYGGRLPAPGQRIVSLFELGRDRACALRVDGRAFCFGRPGGPDVAQLGTVQQIVPVGRLRVCGLSLDGRQVRCIGDLPRNGLVSPGAGEQLDTYDLPVTATTLVAQPSTHNVYAVDAQGEIYRPGREAPLTPTILPTTEEQLRACACELSDSACDAFDTRAAQLEPARVPLDLRSRHAALARFAWETLYEPLDREARPDCADVSRVVFKGTAPRGR